MKLHCKSVCEISENETITFFSQSHWVEDLALCKVLGVIQRKTWGHLTSKFSDLVASKSISVKLQHEELVVCVILVTPVVAMPMDRVGLKQVPHSAVFFMILSCKRLSYRFHDYATLSFFSFFLQDLNIFTLLEFYIETLNLEICQ